jgi:DNA-binding LacI/PurR family transcriptional regulator
MSAVNESSDGAVKGRRPTIMDVARLSGVTPATVSKALDTTGRYLLSDAMRQRVAEAAERVGYRRGQGRELATRVRIIALFHKARPTLDPQFEALSFALAQAVRARGYHLMHRPLIDSERVQQALSNDRDLSGAVVYGELDQPTAASLERSRRPVVLMRGAIDAPLSQAITDEPESAQKLVRHLVDLGHKRIALCTGPTVLPGDVWPLRREGFFGSMRRFGLEKHASVITQDEAASAGGAGFTAIIADTLLTAVGLLHRLCAHGLVIPRDLSLASFDDSEVSEHLSPPLTAIRDRVDVIAQEAASLVIEQVEEQQSLLPRRILVGAELIERASTAAPTDSLATRRAAGLESRH